MAKIQERIKTDYKAMEASRGEIQQCSACGIRYRSHEVQPLCSDCEEQQQAAQAVEGAAPVVEEPSTEAQETVQHTVRYKLAVDGNTLEGERTIEASTENQAVEQVSLDLHQQYYDMVLLECQTVREEVSEPAQTVATINEKITAGTIIKICPWDSAWTNAASATVLSVGEGRIVHYRVEDCESTIRRQVGYTTWKSIVDQAGR